MGKTFLPYELRSAVSFSCWFDAVWRIVPGVVYQFGDAITIHVLGWIGTQHEFHRLTVAPLVNPPQPMVGMVTHYGRVTCSRMKPLVDELTGVLS